jgi:hypothetical protein
MSNDATYWAWKLSGLPPSTRIVLLKLCDCHNPHYGCFPGQKLLARDCEMSRSSINTHLKKLEDAGLIRRIKAVDPVTQRHLTTRYKLAFEADFSLENNPEPTPEEGAKPKNAEPCAETGHGDLFTKTAKAVSKKPQKPCPDSSESRVQNLDTNLVKEPLRETLSVFIAETVVNKEFEIFWQTHPRTQKKAESQKAFEAAVAQGVSAEWLIYAAKAYRAEQAGNGRQYIAQSDNWLSRKGWQDFPQPDQTSLPSLVAIDGSARFWAATIKRGNYVPPSAISPNLAAYMVQKGLVIAADLERHGVRQ